MALECRVVMIVTNYHEGVNKSLMSYTLDLSSIEMSPRLVCHCFLDFVAVFMFMFHFRFISSQEILDTSSAPRAFG